MKLVDIVPKDQRLKILFALGGCVVMTIAFVLMFGFETNEESVAKKVGLINIGSISEEGWSKAHYEGLKSACDEFGLELLFKENVVENSGQGPAAIEELIDDGVGMIFLASYNYPIEAREIIETNKKIEFASNCSEVHSRNMTSYFARMYQGRYLAGALAGMRTKTNVIGYVAAMPNSEVHRGINAFTLGVQRTNPNAKVVVKWTGDWHIPDKEREAAAKLIDVAKADVITYHQDKAVACEVAEEKGVDYIAYNMELNTQSEHYLTSVICRWDIFYKELLRLYLKDELPAIKNYWLGVKEGVVELSKFSDSVTEKQRYKIQDLREELLNDKPIFTGIIYDNQGNMK